jgi:hypothetical protein
MCSQKLRGLVPNTYIHVYVRVIYIPRIGTGYASLAAAKCSKILNAKKWFGDRVGLYLDTFPLLFVGWQGF